MNQLLLDNFYKNLQNIEDYIVHIELVDNLINNNKNIKSETLNKFEEHMKVFHVNKRLFEYKSIIISLYGLIENTIALWIQEHVNNIPKIFNCYHDLEEKFRDTHFNLSIKLISILMENKHLKYEGINKEDILKRLHNAVISTNNFALNNEAYIPVSGNLKHSKIIEALKPLEINLDNILETEKHKIDELVKRRNDIAHGETIDEILNISMFAEYIENLKTYMPKIFNSMIEKELEYQSKKNYAKIEKIYNVFNNSILCFQLENNTIEVGDVVIIKSAENNFFQKKILEIKINNQNFPLVNASNTHIDVGINLGVEETNIKTNQIFFIKNRIDNK